MVKDAAELRVKETDRIAEIESNLRRMGVEIETSADGFRIPGGQTFHAAEIDSAGDHRIAMAFPWPLWPLTGPRRFSARIRRAYLSLSFLVHCGKSPINPL